MPRTAQIPKLTDREIATHLGNIAREFKALALGFSFSFRFLGGKFNLPDNHPENAEALAYVYEANSQIVEVFSMIATDGGMVALAVTRHEDKITDTVTMTDEWINHRRARSPETASTQLVLMTSLMRSEFGAAEVEAALTGLADNNWNTYRRAQTAVIKNLSDKAEHLIVKTAETNILLDQKRAEKFEELERSLREQLQKERESFQAQFEQKGVELESRAKVLAEKEAGFETKESHYVARKQREDQIRDVKAWLQEWGLTRGTKDKRRPIFWAYIVAIIVTALMTAYSAKHSYDLLESATAVSQLLWWQWIGITLKVLVPFGAFTSFIVYFIKWSSAWARQHAEEEFRNRTLLIDIGRSSWLLEAVRDAQERSAELPGDLLKELSRNLFSQTSVSESEIHPTAVSDLLLQGLSSLRVKSPDGSEIEATRNKRP